MCDKTQEVIFDIGSSKFKAGFSEEALPKEIFPSLIGSSENDVALAESVQIGEKAITQNATLKYLKKGEVIDWDVMELLLKCAYDKLNAPSKNHSVLLTEPHFNSNTNREKLTEIMFEKFQVPAMYIASQSLLSLYTYARTTGIVLDSGENHTDIVPIYEGHVEQRGVLRFPVAGRDLTNYLMKLLTERGHFFPTSYEKEKMRELKENLCYVATNFENEVDQYTNPNLEKTFSLPDGREIKIGNEMLRCPEILFRPSILGNEGDGIHGGVLNSIKTCDVHIRKDLYSNILLAGGTTMLPGFFGRLRDEITKLAPASVNVKVFAPPERIYAAWIGGSIVASLHSFQDKWISRNSYDENGPSVIRNKSF